MPMGPGTYGSKKGRPKKTLSSKQKTLPSSLQAYLVVKKIQQYLPRLTKI